MQGSVSGVMVVMPGCLQAAVRSIEDCARQTHRLRSLIVVAPKALHTDLAAGCPDATIGDATELILIESSADDREGTALDLGLAACFSTYVAIWSATARHHPKRIEEQLRRFDAMETIGVGLTEVLHQSRASRDLYWSDFKHGRHTACGGIHPETLLMLRRLARSNGVANPYSALFHAQGRYGKLAELPGRAHLWIKEISPVGAPFFSDADWSHVMPRDQLVTRTGLLESGLSEIPGIFPAKLRDSRGSLVTTFEPDEPEELDEPEAA